MGEAKLRPIPGFPGYEITRDGRVWSSLRGGWWIRPSTNAGGRPKVSLYKSKQQFCRYIHRLVLETFVGPCPDGMEACHNDGDPSNNRIDNLRWDTHAANLADKNRHGTSNRGNRHGMSKLTEQQVRQIIYTYRTGLFTQKEIAEQYGICRENISAIVTRKSWKHLWRAQR